MAFVPEDNETLAAFLQDHDWKEIQTESRDENRVVANFGQRAQKILNHYLPSDHGQGPSSSCGSHSQKQIEDSLFEEVHKTQATQLTALRSTIASQYLHDVRAFRERIKTEYMAGFKAAYVDLMVDGMRSEFMKEFGLLDDQLTEFRPDPEMKKTMEHLARVIASDNRLKVLEMLGSVGEDVTQANVATSERVFGVLKGSNA